LFGRVRRIGPVASWKIWHGATHGAIRRVVGRTYTRGWLAVVLCRGLRKSAYPAHPNVSFIGLPGQVTVA